MKPENANDETNAALLKAGTIGREHGASAATWIDNDVREPSAARVILRAIEDCDGEVLDMFPQPDLSGQWADSYTLRDLLREVGVEDDPELGNLVATAYETNFSEAVEDALAKVARETLEAKE
jgi:hypothetical protein